MTKKDRVQQLLTDIKENRIERVQYGAAGDLLEAFGFKDRTKKFDRAASGGSSRGRYVHYEHPEAEDFGVIKLPKTTLTGQDLTAFGGAVLRFLERHPEYEAHVSQQQEEVRQGIALG